MISICNVDPSQFNVIIMEDIRRNVIEVVVSSVLCIPVIIQVPSAGANFFTNGTFISRTVPSYILFPSMRRLYVIIQSLCMNKWYVTITTVNG